MIKATITTALLGLLLLALPVEGAEQKLCLDRYIGGQLQAGRPGTTHNDDKHETSSEVTMGGGIFGGCRVLPWLSVEAHVDAVYQRMHGCNKGECGVAKSSVNGSQYLVPVTIGPKVAVPESWGWWISPYATVGAGPMVVQRDTTRSEPGGERDDCHGCLALALRGEAGLERRVTEDVSARLGVAHLREPSGEYEQSWVGLSMAYHW